MTHTHTHTPKRNGLVSEASTCTYNTKYLQEKNINALFGIRTRNPSMPAATEIGVIVNYEMHIMAKEANATKYTSIDVPGKTEEKKNKTPERTVGVPTVNETQHFSNSGQNTAA
jgi:hypothetical protein